MSQKRFIAIFVSLVLFSILISTSTFLVRGIEQVIVVRMGNIVQVIDDKTGLYMKWPALDEVIRLDKRIMSLTADAVQVPTSGSEFITISTVAQWRIIDPRMFIKTARTEAAGAALLSQILTAAVRSQAARLTVDKIVGGALIMTSCSNGQENCSSATNSAGTEIAIRARQYGIDVKDFRVLGVSQPPNVREQVESRMVAERLNAAERVYAEGELASARVAADAELQQQQIVSDAQQYHDNFLAVADRDILTKFTTTYRSNQAFYTFFATMNAYSRSLGDNATLMVPTNSEFFQFLKNSQTGSTTTVPVELYTQH